MIVSYRYGFVFIKTKKTASTAVELAFSALCGPDDIVAPIGPGQELDRARTGAFPRNFARNKELERRYLAAVNAGDKRAMRAVSQESRAAGNCTGHMKAALIKEWVGEEFWRSAFKFTTERHPYEKAVSLAFFWHRRRPVGFEQHLDETVRNDYGAYRGFDYYSIDGEPAADDFALHPTLLEDLDRIRRRIGLPEFKLPQARTESRTDRRPAAELLTDEQKQFIYEKCKREFELFGWER